MIYKTYYIQYLDEPATKWTAISGTILELKLKEMFADIESSIRQLDAGELVITATAIFKGRMAIN